MGLLADEREQSKRDHRIRAIRHTVEAMIQKLELELEPQFEDDMDSGLYSRAKRARREKTPNEQAIEDMNLMADVKATLRTDVLPFMQPNGGPTPNDPAKSRPLWAAQMPPVLPRGAHFHQNDSAATNSCHWTKLGGQWLLAKYESRRQHIGSESNLQAAQRASAEASQRLKKKGAVRKRLAPKAERTRRDEADEDAATELTSLLYLARSSRFVAAVPAQLAEDEEWVQCDLPSCAKWRRLPSHVKASTLPNRFICQMISWDPSKARCDAPEDTGACVHTMAANSQCTAVIV